MTEIGATEEQQGQQDQVCFYYSIHLTVYQYYDCIKEKKQHVENLKEDPELIKAEECLRQKVH